MIDAAVVPQVEIRRRNAVCNLCIESRLLEQELFVVGRPGDIEAGVLAGTFQCKEQECLVLFDRTANGSAELLPAEIGLLTSAAVGRLFEIVQGIKVGLAVEEIERAVKTVGSTLGKHIYCGAFAAPIGGRKALRGNIEFFDGFERELHDRPADSAVFVVDSIDGDIHVAAARSIYGENADVSFGLTVDPHRARPT